ncbi:MAG: hypothetical protein ABIS86_20985 [Streptosporangiaceae bacterium]
MQKSWMVADYLRSYARWRLNRADTADGGRNARSALALIDAAVYTRNLDDGDRAVLRLNAAGCFLHGRYCPGVEGERLIRFWHYDEEMAGGPEELLGELAEAAERGLIPRIGVPLQRARS